MMHHLAHHIYGCSEEAYVNAKDNIILTIFLNLKDKAAPGNSEFAAPLHLASF